MVTNVIVEFKSDVVGSNKHEINQLVARTSSSKINGKIQNLAGSAIYINTWST